MLLYMPSGQRPYTYNKTMSNRRAKVLRRRANRSSVAKAGRSLRKLNYHKYARWSGAIGTAGDTTFAQINGTSPTNDTVTNFNFRIGDLPNYTEFQNLYDLYKLTKVVLYLIPKYTANDASLATSTLYTSQNRLFSVIDIDGSNITTMAQIRQYANAKEHNFFKRVKITIYPKPRQPCFTTGTTLGSETAAKQPWIDFVNTETEHFGVALACSAGVATYLQSWSLEAKYYFICRNTR